MSGIIVGIDGSAHSQHALEWAMAEAAIRGTSLTAISVYQAGVGYWGGKPSYPGTDTAGDKARLVAREQVDKALSKAGDLRPPSVNVVTVHGIPAEELIKAASDADLLVVAARGAGGFSRLLLGSVSTQMAHHSHCPVAIVPPELVRL